MKILFFFIITIVTVFSFTCPQQINICPSSEMCSLHCRRLGRAGGLCNMNAIEKKCTCFCYGFKNNTTEKNSVPIEPELFELFELFELEDSDKIESQIYPILEKCPACRNDINNLDCIKCGNMTMIECQYIYSDKNICRIKLAAAVMTDNCTSIICRYDKANICCTIGQTAWCGCSPNNGQATCRCK